MEKMKQARLWMNLLHQGRISADTITGTASHLNFSNVLMVKMEAEWSSRCINRMVQFLHDWTDVEGLSES